MLIMFQEEFDDGDPFNDGTAEHAFQSQITCTAPNIAAAELLRGQCLTSLEKMTTSTNAETSLPSGGSIVVLPFALSFTHSECFCRQYGGHLVSIHSEEDYSALETAVSQSGVKGAVWVGAHEVAEGEWQWTDGSRGTGTLGDGWPSAGPVKNHLMADNFGGSEDQMAFCGTSCSAAYGWYGENLGLHDWGSTASASGNTADALLNPVCKLL